MGNENVENNGQKDTESGCKFTKIAREHFVCFCAALGILIVLFLICASRTSNECTVAVVKEQGQPPKKIAISDISVENAALLLREFESTVYQPQPPASAFYAPCTACPILNEGQPLYGVYDRVREVANHERAHRLPGVVCPWASEHTRHSYNTNVFAWRIAKLEDRVDDIAKGQIRLERMIKRLGEMISTAEVGRKPEKQAAIAAPASPSQVSVQQSQKSKTNAQKALEAIQVEYQKLLKMQETLNAMKKAESGGSALYLQMKDAAKQEQKRSVAAPTRNDSHDQATTTQDEPCPCGALPGVQ